MIPIKELVRGDRVRLLHFGSTQEQYKRKLLSLGLTCGVEFSVIRVAPLGCPIQVEVRGTFLILRREEATQLLLERL